MPAPDVKTLYDFETHFESAAETFLTTATGVSSVGTVNADDFTTPRIEIRFEVGEAYDPVPLRGGGASPSTKDYRNYSGRVLLTIVTDNAAGQVTDHATIRKKTREALALSGSNWDATNNPYYAINYCKPAATEYDADGDFNLTTLQYDVVFTIRSDAWPS